MKKTHYISKEIFKKGMQICFECPSYNPTLKQCKECGCFLFIKAFLTTQKCPLNKWPKESN